jgi:hypothetical protein
MTVLLFDDLVNDVLQTLHGYGLTQPRAAFLSASVGTADTSFSVRDATDFEQGIAEIGNEIVFIDSVDYNSNVLTLAPDGRGYYGTTAAAHSSDDRITMAPTWSRNRIATAINEAIVGTYPTLFGVTSATFQFSPAITTYGLPTLADRVLKVTTDVIGPSQEQPELKRWKFNSTASGSFATGNSITIEKGGFPGKNIYVTYSTVPTAITWGDPFTNSGLAETAKLAIKYAACSSLLAFMDSSRLPVDTAQADEYDPSKNGVGTAMRVSAQLYQRYQVELESERKRLRAATPAIVSVRTR